MIRSEVSFRKAVQDTHGMIVLVIYLDALDIGLITVIILVAYPER